MALYDSTTDTKNVHYGISQINHSYHENLKKILNKMFILDRNHATLKLVL